jgi:glycosyltransferase involved in cell wall biosynthesis
MTQLVSVIIPCYNEAAHIDQLVRNLLSQDYPAECIEILFADGGSEDGTWERLTEFAGQYPFIRVLDNPDKFVSQGLNACIRESKGEIIVRMDVHAAYPADYISVLVARLIATGADNVGGVCDTLPGDDTAEARAIAIATAHPMGIGNSLFRTGVSEECLTDTVPFGCFRREIFRRIGLFDEDLVRNQDDEFNGRIIRSGGSVLLIPSVRIAYRARPTRDKLSSMFYQYGFFKPLVNRKLGAPATLRQFAPPLLVLTGLICLVVVFIQPSWMILFVAWFMGYALGVLAVATSLARRHGWSLWLHLLLTFPVIHFSYGFGYLAGMLRWFLLPGRKAAVRDNR